jgi:hypothetical protein
LQQVFGYDRCNGGDKNDWPAFAMSSLYPERHQPGVHGDAARPAPFPPRWLADMAPTGRTLAQVAGTREEAAQRLERALG